MSLNIIEVAKQLCASIASKAESEAEGIMDDKILMLKLICCTRCPREDDKYESLFLEKIHRFQINYLMFYAVGFFMLDQT